jgi:hypothetical protein
MATTGSTWEKSSIASGDLRRQSQAEARIARKAEFLPDGDAMKRHNFDHRILLLQGGRAPTLGTSPTCCASLRSISRFMGR